MNKLVLMISFGALAAGLVGCGQAGGNASVNSNVPVIVHTMEPSSGQIDHSAMDHSQLKSDPNAAGQPYDLQFIDTMTAHHAGAVAMVKLVDGRTQNPDLTKFASHVVADQEKEIAQMKGFREKWFAGKPTAINMEMPGMASSMKMEMSRLTESKDKEFDLAFVEMMTPHHAGAVTMSKEALTKAEHPEIKTLANQIIKAQEAEIKLMAQWKAGPR